MKARFGFITIVIFHILSLNRALTPKKAWASEDSVTIELLNPTETFRSQVKSSCESYAIGLRTQMQACCALATPIKVAFCELMYPGYLDHLRERIRFVQNILSKIDSKASPFEINKIIMSDVAKGNFESVGILRTLFSEQTQQAYQTYMSFSRLLSEIKINPAECALCNNAGTMARYTQCGHIFCKSCIEDWHEKKGEYVCPTCLKKSSGYQEF